MDATSDPAFRRRAGDGPVFSSTRCPQGPGLKHSCELPFGFVWTPLSPTDTCVAVPSEQRGAGLPPVLCLTCLAYLNLYATFDAASGEWTCPLCASLNVAPSDVFDAAKGEKSLLSSALLSPLVEYRQTVGTDNMSTVDPENTRYYVMVMDGNLGLQEAQSVAVVMQKLLREEVQRGTNVRLGLLVFDKMVSLYQLGLTGIASADVIHRQETDQQIVQRRANMVDRSYFADIRAEGELESLALCISAVFGFPMNSECKHDHAVAAVSSCHGTLSRKEQLRRKKEARLQKQASDTNWTDPNTGDESPWIKSQRVDSTSGVRCTGEAIQWAMDLIAFGSTVPPRSSRILLFTNGCPNIGNGTIVRDDAHGATRRGTKSRPIPDIVDPIRLSNSMQYFELMAKDALDGGIAIDVFCTGAETLGMPTYQALVEPSGGYALPLETFVSQHFERDMRFVVSQTHVSRSRISDEMEGLDRPECPSTNQIDGCLVDIRMSSFVAPTHVLGSGKVLYDEASHRLLPSERSAFAMSASLAADHGLPTNNLPSQDMLAATLTRLRLGRFDPLSTVSAMLQVNDDIQQGNRYAFFQCTVRYVEDDGKTFLTRVFTHRLPVAVSVHDFLDGTDEEAVPVLLGKEAVFRSVVGREEPEEIEAAAADTNRLEFLAREAQRDLDATVHMISGAFRLLILEEGTTRRERSLAEMGAVFDGSPSSLDFAFPPELADALHRLFHLRRGPLLSPGPLKSVDDRALARSLFLRLPLDDCQCMMAPSLWRADRKESQRLRVLRLESVPSDTLALWDSCIIAADHHDSLFVFSGRDVEGSEYDEIREQCKDFLLRRSVTRFPMPELHVVCETDSMKRRFTTRLAPSHADPPDQQMAHFPALATLSQGELTSLRDKFRFYDASTDASFRRWFWSIASASSNARKEGMSLCE